MWTVIYVACNEAERKKVEKRLTEEGFLVKVKQIGRKDGAYEVLVPRTEASEAHQVLIQLQ
ncbi:MAG TPA: hypothetical protein GX503_03280 [Clostridiales bacterium]|nr:hypothetical protein [Clostridiales bacterium]